MARNPPATDPAEDLSDSPTCYCPIDGVIDLLSRKYAMQVICVVGALEPIRYRDIEAQFGGASSSTLSARLGELTEAGFLNRDRYDEIPPRVEYTLTSEGEELCDRLDPLLEWVENRA